MRTLRAVLTVFFVSLLIPAFSQKLGKDSLIVNWAETADSLQDLDVGKAIGYWKKVEQRAVLIHNRVAEMESCFEMALLLNREGHFVEANTSMIKAIRLANEQKLKQRAITFKTFQFDFFFNLENLDLVREKLKELEEDIKTASVECRLRYYAAKSELSVLESHFTEAEQVYKKALSIAVANKLPTMETKFDFCLAQVSYQLDKIDEAIVYLKRAIQLDRESGFYTGLLTDYGFMAQLYIEGKYDAKSGLLYLDKLMDLYHTVHIQRRMDEIYDLFYEAYKLENNWQKALQYHEMSIAIRDSLLSEDEKEMLATVENKYQSEHKQAEILNLKARQKDQEKIISTGKQNSQLAYIGLVLALLMLTGLGYGYYHSRRYNRLLRARDGHRELLLREVHHRINNSLQLIRSLMNLQARATDNLVVKDLLQQTEARVNSMAAMHEILNRNDSSVNINVKDYLEKVFEFHRDIMAGNSQVQLVVDIANAVIPTNKATPIALVVNELLTNALKHAFPDGRPGKITVLLKEENPGKWLFRVSDNGVGMPAALLDMQLKSKGLGCKVVKIMAEQLDGNLVYSNTNGLLVELRFSINPDKKLAN